MFSLSTSLRTCLLHLALEQLVDVAARFHIHSQHLQSVGMLQHFQNKVVTQNNGKFAVFEDTLDSFAWFCLCFAFDARCAPVFEWDVCQLLFHLSQARNAHMVLRLASLLPRQEFCHCQMDPQQLVARLRHHAWTNHMYFANFAILQFAKMSSVNLQLVRMTFLNLQLPFSHK